MMQKKIKVQLPLGETVELYEQEVKSLVNKLKKTVEVIVVDNGKEKEMTEEIQKRMEEIVNKYSYIRIEDLSNYVADKSNNGGCYAFSTWYVWDAVKEKYRVSYSTTAEFQFCDGCGHFNCCNCDYEYVTEADVEKAIAVAEEEDRIRMEVVVEEEKDVKRISSNN